MESLPNDQVPRPLIGWESSGSVGEKWLAEGGGEFRNDYFGE